TIKTGKEPTTRDTLENPAEPTAFRTFKMPRHISITRGRLDSEHEDVIGWLNIDQIGRMTRFTHKKHDFVPKVPLSGA
ncbi:unnamed protein product, partial [marine sediment metagenome]